MIKPIPPYLIDIILSSATHEIIDDPNTKAYKDITGDMNERLRISMHRQYRIDVLKEIIKQIPKNAN